MFSLVLSFVGEKLKNVVIFFRYLFFFQKNCTSCYETQRDFFKINDLISNNYYFIFIHRHMYVHDTRSVGSNGPKASSGGIGKKKKYPQVQYFIL